jgi:hypothetical protein
VLRIAQQGLPAAGMGAPQQQMATGQAPLNQRYGAALPQPHQIVGRNWLNLDPDTQQFLLGAYEANGYSGNQVLNSIQQMLPGAAAWRGGYAGIGR